MMHFGHFVITRFNLPLFRGSWGGKPDGNLDPVWLKRRFELFERYCFPSVRAQSCQDFRWLVLLDARTPDPFRKRMESLQREYDRLVPCYLDPEACPEPSEVYRKMAESYEQTLRQVCPDRRFDLDIEGERTLRHVVPPFLRSVISSFLPPDADWILTTRIDSDDALHRDFIASVQALFRQDPGHQVYDFVHTYKYITEERIVYRYPLRNGHFITLAEPADTPFQSVFYWNHLFVEHFLPVKHIYREALQLEVVHGGNVVNGFTELSASGLLHGWLFFRPGHFGLRALPLSGSRFFRMLGWTVKNRRK